MLHKSEKNSTIPRQHFSAKNVDNWQKFEYPDLRRKL